MKWKFTYPFAMVFMGLAGFFGWQLTARAAYESAEYKVIESDGDFEIREYPELTLVTTPMPSDRQGEDGSFMRLFRYISGANESQQKVEMTTPVFMQQPQTEKNGRMSFVLPKKVAEDGAPRPAAANVELQQRSGGRFAVVRFAGRADEKAYAEAERRLRTWMDNRQLTAADAVERAGYDPPWTPGPLRRNEVLIRLK